MVSDDFQRASSLEPKNESESQEMLIDGILKHKKQKGEIINGI